MLNTVTARSSSSCLQAPTRTILSATDQVAVDGRSRDSAAPSKQDLHYLLTGANVLTLPTTIVESVARIDGAVVMRPTG